jgi:hypothetical protein
VTRFPSNPAGTDPRRITDSPLFIDATKIPTALEQGSESFEKPAIYCH